MSLEAGILRARGAGYDGADGAGDGGGIPSRLQSLESQRDDRLDGIDAGDLSGWSVASAGDVNGDGFGDILIGATSAEPGAANSVGESYVVFGRGPDGPRTRTGSVAGQYISGGAFADTLSALGGSDEIEGRGAADALRGGTQLDTASYRHAPKAVVADLARPANNTGHARGDRYNSIENLAGSGFNDTLRGNAKANVITGNGGADKQTGRGGSDRFRLLRSGDSPVGAGRDSIADFNAGTSSTVVDRIDVSAIDAKTGPGNQAFTFGPFNGTKGRLRARLAGTTTLIEGDANGDNIADFQIALLNFTSLANLTARDFIP